MDVLGVVIVILSLLLSITVTSFICLSTLQSFYSLFSSLLYSSSPIVGMFYHTPIISFVNFYIKYNLDFWFI